MINSPVIYQLNERGRLEWRMTADALSLGDGKWGLQEAEKIRNDGQVEQLGNITLATRLDERVLLRASAPPDTVSVFGLPGFISMLQQTGLPANAHQVRFHQLLASPFLLLGLIMLAAGFTVVHFPAARGCGWFCWGWGQALLFILCPIWFICWEGQPDCLS